MHGAHEQMLHRVHLMKQQLPLGLSANPGALNDALVAQHWWCRYMQWSDRTGPVMASTHDLPADCHLFVV